MTVSYQVINAIPSNFVDLTSGGVVFSNGAWGPLSGSYVGMDSEHYWNRYPDMALDNSNVNETDAVHYIGAVAGSGVKGLVHDHSGSNIDVIGCMFRKTIDLTRFSTLRFTITRERGQSIRSWITANIATSGKVVKIRLNEETYGNIDWPIDYVADISGINGHCFFSFHTRYSGNADDVLRIDYIGFE